MHGAVPLNLLYIPAMQPRQGPPSGPSYPARHMHASEELLARGAKEPSGQEEHADAASCAPYFPAGQSRQVAMLDAPTNDENVLIGQDKHVVARIDEMYFPLEQLSHTVDASATEKVPATHCPHVVFAGAATTDDALPAGQFEHVPGPFDALYCPESVCHVRLYTARGSTEHVHHHYRQDKEYTTRLFRRNPCSLQDICNQLGCCSAIQIEILSLQDTLGRVLLWVLA